MNEDLPTRQYVHAGRRGERLRDYVTREIIIAAVSGCLPRAPDEVLYSLGEVNNWLRVFGIQLSLENDRDLMSDNALLVLQISKKLKEPNGD